MTSCTERIFKFSNYQIFKLVPFPYLDRLIFRNMKKLLYSFLILTAALLSFSDSSAQKKNRNKNSTLAGTNWKLAYAGNTPYNPPPGVRLVSMTLNDSTKNITGFLGCNTLAGNYMLFGKDGITFTVVSTKKACTPDAMRVENELSTALNDANKYKIDGDKLALFKDDTFIAAFIAQKEETPHP